MVLQDELFQALLEHVRVDLGRGDVGLAEQLLHRAQVGAAVEQVAGGLNARWSLSQQPDGGNHTEIDGAKEHHGGEKNY
jgi:hypothetical protein